MGKADLFFDLPVGNHVDATKIKQGQITEKDKKITKKNIFDHLKAITQKKYNSNYFKDREDLKTFDVYMINRFLSMNPDWIELVNWSQQYTYDMPAEIVYKFYADMIPKSATFLKYVKGTDDRKYNKELIGLMAAHFQCSTKDAKDMLGVILKCKNGKEKIISFCRMYAIGEKRALKLLK